MEHIIDTFFETFTLEIDKFNLDKDDMIYSIKELSSTFDEDFDVPYERCAYMYRYSAIHFSFLKEIIHEFLSGYKDSAALIEGWRPESNFCSFSFGPGLDYLAFTFALLELKPKSSLPVFRNIDILTKYGAWRNTVNLLSDVIWKAKQSKEVMKNIKFNGLNVFQTNIFSKFKENAIEILKTSDVVLMFKLLNFTSSYDNGDIEDNLKKLASNVKPGATIFFIDTMLSCSTMQKVLSGFNGMYLHGPVRVNHVFPDDFSEELIEVWGRAPTKSARGVFFVWKKYIPESGLNIEGPQVETLDNLFSTLKMAPINANSKKEFNSNMNIMNPLQIKPTLEGKCSFYNGMCSKSNSAEETSNMSDELLTLKDLLLEPNVLTSTVNSLKYKDISSVVSNEKDPVISKPLKESKCTQTDPVTETLSENQLSIIKSLTVKINNLASLVENDFEFQHQTKRNKDSITAMVSEKLNTIEHITERINGLISSVESVLNNQSLDNKNEEILDD